MATASPVPTVKPEAEKIHFRIHKYSSYASYYHPSNIQDDKPFDQASRWSSESNNPPQFLLLKLAKYAIVHSITFGKYEKTHVCNLKKLKVFGGMEEDNMLELLEGGLKNDSKSETFILRSKVGGKPFACRYIKIVPIQSWGSSFNFTIWYVELTGNTKWSEVSVAIEWLSTHRKNEAIRYCLHFLRQMNYKETFKSLQKVSKVPLEHSAMTELYEHISTGDYVLAEEFVEDAITNGMMNNYISKLDYKPLWQSIMSERPRPGMRGGHQMFLDNYSDTIYLLGGWDGHHDLSDLWAYNILSNSWSLLSSDTSADGGPSARSCHKVCTDTYRRQVFVLGRYLDIQGRTPAALKSDFFVLDIERLEWTKITDDTSAMGGPKLIFDHQMCMDSATSTIYVFGGRVLQATPPSVGETSNAHPEPVYSGLYSFHVPTNTWRMITTEDDTLIRSRVGHSMLFHPVYRKLYIFAGQRNKDYLNDFFSYHVDTGNVEYLCEGSTKDCNNIPAAGFTQRATINTDLDEIYVLSGLSKEKDKRDDNVQNSFWVFYIQQNKWTCIYKSETPNVQYWNKLHTIEPCPRFAHQLVYDYKSKVHYLFGGNPGMSCLPKLRLDDFWKLYLIRPSNFQLRRQCKLLIRKYRFRELVQIDTEKAINYLQTSLHEIIDHNNLEESAAFKKMGMLLFRGEQLRNQKTPPQDVYALRVKLFNELSKFFPESMTQPKTNLLDLIPL